MLYGTEIHPNDYAITTKEVVVEIGKLPVQENEEKTGDINVKNIINNRTSSMMWWWIPNPDNCKYDKISYILSIQFIQNTSSLIYFKKNTIIFA